MDYEHRRRQGQTLAEFAITLPILLLLMFGIIEFGRIFQAWVTLQNSARAAARYASTGQYDPMYETSYKMNFDRLEDPDGLIPCVASDDRGSKTVYKPDVTDSYEVNLYSGGQESLFASWNDGLDCNPENLAHQDARKDMLRLLSIMEEARKGASGLYLEENPMKLPADADAAKDIRAWPWASVWSRPYARSDQRAWFHVMICSQRDPWLLSMVDADPRDRSPRSTNYLMLSDAASGSIEVTDRFLPYLDESAGAVRNSGDVDLALQPNLPGCVLGEKPTADAMAKYGLLDNAGVNWMDAGGPGDTTTVVVTFNHPLITPLGLTSYIQMQARRSVIVESFRPSNAPDLGIPKTGTGNVILTATYTPSNTPTITLTPSMTTTWTPQPSATNTYTPSAPFLCERIKAGNLQISGRTVTLDIANENQLATYLTNIYFQWPEMNQYGYPDMYLSSMALNGIEHWKGKDTTPPTDTNSSNPEDKSISPFKLFQDTDTGDRTIGAFDVGTWSALFSIGPVRMEDYSTIYDYAGTSFSLYNPTNPSQPCFVTLDQPTPTPSPTFNPKGPTRTPTATPDCASSHLSVRFVRFEKFGIMRLEVVNNRNTVAPFTGFVIQWKKATSGTVYLKRVNVVAAEGLPGSVQVWESKDKQDYEPPTTSSNTTEGTWLQNYTFSPNSITPLLIDFDGTNDTLDNKGISPVAFNGTRFIIGCTLPGGGSGTGPGTGQSGEIVLEEVPPPPPTNTPGPSKTPAPTNTPPKVPTPKPWTDTPQPTKKPATAVPTNTPRPTVAPTNTPLPTDIDWGDTDA